MQPLDLGSMLRAARQADPASIPSVVSHAAQGLGATDVVVYLADFGQTVLVPLGDGAIGEGASHSEEVATTMAGRVFAEQRAADVERPDGTRIWVPIVEGSNRAGVLALTVPELTDGIVARCEELGILAGYLIAAQSRSTDLYDSHRRRRSMTLAASMQWDLLPPLVLTTKCVAVAALIEPAYEVGGDCFDYSLNGSVFDLAVMDAMGHGVASALIAALTIGSYRHDRREGRSLQYIHEQLEAAMSSRYRGEAFSTGQLVRIELETGELTWMNAGHPLPMLIRGGQVIGELACAPTPPWGLGSGLVNPEHAQVATESLEPGDSVLLYTDGVVESRRSEGDRFGVDRLADLVGQHASELLEPEEIVRRLIRAVVEHQRSDLADDASIVLAQWKGPR